MHIFAAELAPVNHLGATASPDSTLPGEDAEYLDWLDRHADELAEMAEAEDAVESGCWAW